MDKIIIRKNRNGEYIDTLKVNTPARCEKCDHEVEIFKSDNFHKGKEELLTICFYCGVKHKATMPCGFWWLYSSVLAWDMMYKEIRRSEREQEGKEYNENKKG